MNTQTTNNSKADVCFSKKLATALLIWGCFWLTGCKNVQPPGGTPIDRDAGLGSVVDQINRQQEENAEASKFVVYQHEFEVNVPLKTPEDDEITKKFRFKPRERVRGFRLNEFGEEHVLQIASYFTARQQNGNFSQPMWNVVVERSNTSKHWDTRHRYPVHFNRELDEARRQTVVMALTQLGVQNADEFVIVAPAFAEGMEAQQSAATYSRSR